MIARTFIDNAQSERPVGEGTLAEIRRTVQNALEYMEISFPCEVSVKLVSRAEIKQLNRDFRGVDEETDVLSFPSGEYTGKPPKLKRNERLFLGDMAICVDIAYTQAKAAKHTPRSEINLLTAHSVLHLLGLDHATKREERSMFEKQEAIVALGIQAK